MLAQSIYQAAKNFPSSALLQHDAMFSSYGNGTKLPVAWCPLHEEDGRCQECGGSLVWGMVLLAHQEDKGWQECVGLVGQG